MNRPNYYFMVKFTDGTSECYKIKNIKNGFKMLEEIQIKEPVKFAQLVKDNR